MRRWLALSALGMLSVAGVQQSSAAARTIEDVSQRPASLRGQFGIERYRELLEHGSAIERRLARARLSAIGTPRALQHLNEALLRVFTNPVRSSEARHLIELLAAHTGDAQTQSTLLRVLTAQPNEPSVQNERVRGLAAMALAAAGQSSGLVMLGRALRGDAKSSQLAAAALLAHPPRDLAPLLADPGSVAVAELLGSLADQRAFTALRRWVRSGRPALQEAALLALCQLGDYEVSQVAERWLAEPASLARRAVATRVLAFTGHPAAGAALAELLRRPEQRRSALALARQFPQLAALGPLTSSVTSEEMREVIAILARSTKTEAVSWLVQRLHEPRWAGLAETALAQSPAAGVRAWLVGALRQKELRRPAARIAVLRTLRFQERYAALRALLATLESATDQKEQGVGSWGLAALDPDLGIARLSGRHKGQVLAAARTALVQPLSFFHAAAQRLAQEQDPELQAALAFALRDPSSAALVPNEPLLALATGKSLTAPLAAFALAQRDDERLRDVLQELVTSPDLSIRAHTVLGLGRSGETNATGLLVSLYDDEAWQVRWAAITALSQRSGALRHETLQRAARLEPNETVRSAARAALAEVQIALFPRGPLAAELGASVPLLDLANTPLELTIAAPHDLSKATSGPTPSSKP